MHKVVVFGLVAAAGACADGTDALVPGSPPPTGTLEVAAVGLTDDPAWVVIAEPDGTVAAFAPIADGQVRSFERSGDSTVLLLRTRRDGTCRSVDGFDAVPLGEQVRFDAAPPSYEHILPIAAHLRLLLPEPPPGTAVVWASGCGHGSTLAPETRVMHAPTCFVDGGTTRVLVTARSATGALLGATAATLAVSAGDIVDFEVAPYDRAAVEHTVALQHIPTGVGHGAIRLWNRDPQGLPMSFAEFPFEVSDGAAQVALSFPADDLAPTATIELSSSWGSITLRSLDASTYRALPSAIDAGGDFPVVVGVTRAESPRPRLGWTLAGSGAPDAFEVRSARGGVLWHVVSRAARAVHWTMPELPAALAACAPAALPGDQASVTVFDADGDAVLREMTTDRGEELGGMRRASRIDAVQWGS